MGGGGGRKGEGQEHSPGILVCIYVSACVCRYTYKRVVIRIVCAIYINGKSHINEKKINNNYN